MISLTQNYLTRGFWGDEAWTSLISQLPYVQMLKTTAADFHPPGYYTIIELLYKFVAPTEINTRIVSIFFYFLTIFLVYKLASLAFTSFTSEESGPTSEVDSVKDDKKTFLGLNKFGLISAIVVAVNPIFFTYAFEARNYTMFAFAATGSIYYLLKFSTSSNNRFNGALFVLFSTLGIYTHYYMFFVLAAQFFYILLFDRKILLRVFGLHIVVGVLYLPWIPFLLSQLKSVAGDYWIGGIDKRTHFEAFLRILGGEHKNIFRPWLFGISIGLLIIGIGQHLMRHKFERPYLLTWLWATVPFILATLPGLRIAEIQLPFRSIFFWRYLIPASIPLAMVMVHSAQKLPRPLYLLIMCALITLSVLINADTFKKYPYTFKQVYTEQVVPNISGDDKIVTVLPSFAEVLYYRNRNNLENDLVVLSEGLVQFSGKSLLDAYVENGVVKISYVDQKERYFELSPGPNAHAVE